MGNPKNETLCDFLIQITNKLYNLLTAEAYSQGLGITFFPLTVYILHFIIS